MRSDLTEISIVLDRSGSMAEIQDDTIGGFNTFLRAQQEQPGECRVSLAQFDDVYEQVYMSRWVREAPYLTRATFVVVSTPMSPR